MFVHTNLEQLPDFQNAVITIGSFDGVHAGHQEILRRLCAAAAEIGGESVVITFDPHPRLIIYPDDHSLKLINTTEEKCRLLAELGVQHTVLVLFDRKFAQQSSDEYITDFLYKYFKPKQIIIGYDHRFGRARTGDISFLQQRATQFGYTVMEIPKQTVDALEVSSTKIRRAIEAGDLLAATQLLAHPFALTGRVIQGDQLGRTLGFPTANLELIDLEHQLLPPDGIYAVWVHHQQKRYGGMLYIGVRPTVRGQKELRIEVNILNFEGDIYGSDLRVDFVERLRGDMRLNSLDELKQQMHYDREAAIVILAEKYND